jgi:hypothetical protein
MNERPGRDYYEKRAAEERAAADRAADERIAEPHRELARRYDELASGEREAGDETPADAPAGLAPEFRILP